MQENLDYNVTASVLASAAGRALGVVISKSKMQVSMHLVKCIIHM
jgi:hypothetical protein